MKFLFLLFIPLSFPAFSQCECLRYNQDSTYREMDAEIHPDLLITLSRRDTTFFAKVNYKGMEDFRTKLLMEGGLIFYLDSPVDKGQMVNLAQRSVLRVKLEFRDRPVYLNIEDEPSLNLLLASFCMFYKLIDN